MFKQSVVRRKSPEQIALMRAAGRVVAEMHDEIRRAIRPGVTTAQLDQIGRQVLDKRGATSNFLGYNGTYPAVICASPNDMVVHGIPGPYRLADGDIVSIDCGAILAGWHGDAAFTVAVGDVPADVHRLVDVTEAALHAGIARMVPGNRIGDIGAAVEQVVDEAGFWVVHQYAGHGIGTAMHEEPTVPNHGPAGKGQRLQAGTVLAVEPMVAIGTPESVVLDDGWSVVTADGSLAAHWEHTIAVTDDGPQILTLP